MEITSLISGIVIGSVLAYIILYLFFKTKNVSKQEYETLSEKFNSTSVQMKVFEEKATTFNTNNEKLQKQNEDLLNQNTTLNTAIVRLEANTHALTEKLTSQKQQTGTMKEKNSINDASETKMRTMLCLDISEQQDMRLLGTKLNLLHLRRGHNAGR